MIILRNLSNSRAIRRMIERQIFNWIKGRNSVPEDAQFNAFLCREGAGHDVTCEVEIVKPDGIWKGRTIASAPDLAIKLALRSMKLAQSRVEFLRPAYATPGG